MNKLDENVEVSVILPTFNESENIGFLIDEIVRLLGEKRYEIITVDDDSPDKTWKIVEEKANNDKRIRLFRRINKRGLVSALDDGISAARGKIIVWMDSDFQMPPSTIPILLEAIVAGSDVAVGSRFIKQGKDIRYDKNIGHRQITNIHKYLSRFICLATSVLFLTNHKDWTSGFIAIKKTVLDGIKLQGDYGEYFMYLLHHLIKSGYSVTEIPYTLLPRRSGTSKTARNYFNLTSKGIRYLLAVFRLTFCKKNRHLLKNKCS